MTTIMGLDALEAINYGFDCRRRELNKELVVGDIIYGSSTLEEVVEVAPDGDTVTFKWMDGPDSLFKLRGGENRISKYGQTNFTTYVGHKSDGDYTLVQHYGVGNCEILLNGEAIIRFNLKECCMSPIFIKD